MPKMTDARSIAVECAPYGTKKISYPASMTEQENGRKLLSMLEENWEQYWSAAIETTSEMAEQVLDIYDFSASFETHDFILQVFDMEDWGNKIPLWITFLDSNSETIAPIFDTTFEDEEVVHCQPVF